MKLGIAPSQSWGLAVGREGQVLSTTCKRSDSLLGMAFRGVSVVADVELMV